MLNHQEPTINRWHYVLSGLVIMLLGTVYSYSVFREALEQTLSIGAAASGLPYMVSLASYALAMFFTGRWMDRFPAFFWICLPVIDFCLSLS